MVYRKSKLPLKTAIFDKAFSLLIKSNQDPLTVEDIKKMAIKKTGLNDFGDSYFEEGLVELVKIANNNGMNSIGNLMLKSSLVHNLSNRLILINELKTNKAIANVKMIPPIIIMGLPRSGTTLLHRMLTQDVNNKGIPFWELFRPINEPDKKDYRKLKSKLELKGANFIKGDVNHIHYTAHNEPEECVWLFGGTFNALLYWIQFPLYSYLDWFIEHDRIKKYIDYSHYLHYFQSQHPTKRLVMKSPEHSGSVLEIYNTIPEAILIETHRDPVECANSLNSLIYSIHRPSSIDIDKKELALANLKLLESELKKNELARKNAKIKIIDVLYNDLVSGPLKTIETIYSKIGIDLDAATRLKMKAYLVENPKNKFGSHTYSAQSFGIDDEIVRKRLSRFDTIIETN
ncbi:MAG: sulfotransferase [Bacteroidales bacterium]|jgi:hypothetical protein